MSTVSFHFLVSLSCFPLLYQWPGRLLYNYYLSVTQPLSQQFMLGANVQCGFRGGSVPKKKEKVDRWENGLGKNGLVLVVWPHINTECYSTPSMLNWCYLMARHAEVRLAQRRQCLRVQESRIALAQHA